MRRGVDPIHSQISPTNGRENNKKTLPIFYENRKRFPFFHTTNSLSLERVMAEIPRARLDELFFFDEVVVKNEKQSEH